MSRVFLQLIIVFTAAVRKPVDSAFKKMTFLKASGKETTLKEIRCQALSNL